MAESKPKFGKNQLKVVGGIALLASSVGIFVHRIPKRAYVEVHADKPRVVAKAQDSAPAETPVARPSVRPVTPQSLAQAQRGPKIATMLQPGAPPVTLVELEEACSTEIGILCYKVAPKQLRRCLSQYDDAARKNCRDALNRGKTSSR